MFPTCGLDLETIDSSVSCTSLRAFVSSYSPHHWADVPSTIISIMYLFDYLIQHIILCQTSTGYFVYMCSKIPDKNILLCLVLQQLAAWTCLSAIRGSLLAEYGSLPAVHGSLAAADSSSWSVKLLANMGQRGRRTQLLSNVAVAELCLYRLTVQIDGADWRHTFGVWR